MAEPRTIQIERKHSRALNASIETFSRIHTFPHNPNPNPPLPSKIGVGFQIQKHWGSSPHSTINHTPLTPQNICHTFPHPTHHTALVAQALHSLCSLVLTVLSVSQLALRVRLKG